MDPFCAKKTGHLSLLEGVRGSKGVRFFSAAHIPKCHRPGCSKAPTQAHAWGNGESNSRIVQAATIRRGGQGLPERRAPAGEPVAGTEATGSMVADPVYGRAGLDEAPGVGGRP